MRRIPWLLLIFLVLGQLVTSSVADDKAAVVEGNNAFALDLYAELKDAGGNLLFSPFSISTALAMTYAGARGNTEKQMAEVMHFELEQERLHPAFGELVDELNRASGTDGYELRVANALWGQKGYRFLEEFLELIRKNYGGGFDQVDFATATERARHRINGWVENKTKGKIKELIKPGILTSWTRLVLTNAIYFRGYWSLKFEREKTRKAPFRLLSGAKVEVPMMQKVARFKYLETEDFQILELPYGGDHLSMVILLPRDRASIRGPESAVTLRNLSRWLPSLSWEEVTVSLPRFRVTSQFRLDQTLNSMGMIDAFGEANFSGMTGKRELFISAVLHQALVEVNEEGTEAAGATAGVMEETGPERRPHFNADHPFIFLIRDLHSNSILFMGRVMDPRE